MNDSTKNQSGFSDSYEVRDRHFLRILMDSIPDAIYFKDRESRFLLINRAQSVFLGLSDPGDAIGKTDFDFFSAETAREAFNDEQKLIASGTPLVAKEEQICFPDKQSRWVSATKVPVRDASGGITGIVGISRDIHERKLAEDRLQQERNLLTTLMDNMPDLIYVKDRQSRFLVCNTALQAFIGMASAAGVIGKTDFDFFPRDDARKYYEDEQMIMSTGRPNISVEEAAVSAAGVQRWILSTKVPLLMPDGAIIGLVGIGRDITDRRQMEEELRKTRDELEARVLQRTADLQQANERIEVRLNQLNFLNRTSFMLGQLTSEEDLYPAIIEAFAARFERAEACICVKGKKEFSCVSATTGLNTPKSRAQCEKALMEYMDRDMQTPVIIDDWQKDRDLRRSGWSGCTELPCYIAIPLLADNTMISCVQIFTTGGPSGHFEREKPLLTTLAAHAAVCQSNARRYRELSERARLEGELEAARSIQLSYMPQNKPPIPHVNVTGVYYPAFEVGGDYLDFFLTERGVWVLVVADVCGKGVPAALHMTVLRSVFRSEARTLTSAKDIMCAVNDTMRIHLDNKSFITALCLVVSADGTEMTCARAGHPLLLKMGSAGQAPVNVPCNGVALGLVSDNSLFTSLTEEVRIGLKKGDSYLVYTDGLTEALNAARDTYGFDRLSAALERERNRTPDKIISSIMKDVREFNGNTPFHDDLTMFAMCVY